MRCVIKVRRVSYRLWSCISAAGTQRSGSARVRLSAAWSWFHSRTCSAGTPRLFPGCSSKHGPRTHSRWRGFLHLGKFKENNEKQQWLPEFLPLFLVLLKLTYVDRGLSVLPWGHHWLNATLLGVWPVDSVPVGEVNSQAGRPTQSVWHQDLPLLAVQPRALNLWLVSTVGPVQHPAETQCGSESLGFWRPLCEPRLC